MNKLKELIAKAQQKLLRAEKRLEVAGHRWQVNHDLAHQEHHKQKDLEHRAAKTKDLEKRDFLLDLARRHSHRANKAHRRALYWIGAAKKANKAQAHIKAVIAIREGKVKEIEARGAHRAAPNKIEGGSAKDRLELAMHLSMEEGSKFYSQTGALDLHHGITGPSAGHRHDCSSWDASIDNAAGLPDPTGQNYEGNVWTGNLSEHGEHVSEDQLDTGCDVYFGVAPFHHVEKKIGPMHESNLTVGHGSAPIDYGSVNLLPGPRAYRRFVK